MSKKHTAAYYKSRLTLIDPLSTMNMKDAKTATGAQLQERLRKLRKKSSSSRKSSSSGKSSSSRKSPSKDSDGNYKDKDIDELYKKYKKGGKTKKSRKTKKRC